MFEVQDEGSQLMTLLIGVETTMRILDMCAGKGTKTILMSNLLKSEGTITAYDKIKERLGVFKSRVKELKLKNINFERFLVKNVYIKFREQNRQERTCFGASNF